MLNDSDPTPPKTEASKTDETSLGLAYRQSTKRLTRWRIGFFVILFIGLIGIGTSLNSQKTTGDKEHIGVVSFQSMIIWPEDTIGLIERMAKDAKVKAIIVRMDSPGGAVTGSEALYKAIQKANEAKPVAIVVENVAASGGYLAALGGRRIFALETSLVGSIGVYMQWYEGGELLNSIGIKPRILKSSIFKGEPSFSTHADDRITKALQDELDTVALWFKNKVGETRDLKGEALDNVTDGKIFIGKKAIDLGLIDAIGGVHEAQDWLESEYDLKGLKLIDWHAHNDDFFEMLLDQGLSKAFSTLMISEPKHVLSGIDQIVRQQSLQGMLALWKSSH